MVSQNSGLNHQKIQTTRAFRETIKAISEGYRIIIHEGGTRSGKTWANLATLIALAGKFEGKFATVCSESLPHLRLGAMRDFYTLLGGSYRESNHNKSETAYTLNSNHIEFYGVDNPGKVRGPARDWLFINEANRIKQDVWDQLDPRTRELILIDFNPDREFWAHDLKGRADVKWIHSTYLDNDQLDARIVDSIESRKGLENWWKVYGLGILGNIENIIYTNWKMQTFDDSLPFGFGMDFGFSSSEDALVKVAIDKKKQRIYMKECLYSHGNSTAQLREKMKPHVKGNNMVIADSADPRLISELRSPSNPSDVKFNMKSVSKYGGSVRDGIKIMQSYEICVEPTSENLIKELKYYRWKDRGAELPEQAFDHLMDAARYYVMTMLSGRKKTKMV